MNTLLTPTTTSRPDSTAQITQRGLILFFALTLGWMAVCGGLAILVAHGLIALPLSPLALVSLGGLMPMVAALVATGYEAEWAGVRTLLGQLALRPLAYRGCWSAVALAGMALIVFLAMLLSRVLGEPQPPLPPAATWQTLPMLAVVYLLIALIEEVGWRGYALPRLQARHGPLAASVLLGVIWGCWHLPQWFIPATGQAAKWPFLVFLLHTVAFSLLLTWLYNRSGGSLWPVILAHAAFNLYPEPWAAAWQSMSVEQRGVYPVILITVVETVVALLVVYWAGLRLDQPKGVIMSMLTKAITQPTINSGAAFAKFLAGFVLIYGTLEGMARLLGDALPTVNALLITAAVLVAALAVEMAVFQQSWRQALSAMGLGRPGWRALGLALLICVLQLACYPLISWLTGYRWTLPANWAWTMVGIFALHGVAEEVLYRAYLFGRLRTGRTFWRAAWLAVVLFALSHLPILANQGLVVGGMALALAISSSFPLAHLYEQGHRTIWAPALVHGAVDTVIPILAAGGLAGGGQQAALIWMGVSMALPYLAFVFGKPTEVSR